MKDVYQPPFIMTKAISNMKVYRYIKGKGGIFAMKKFLLVLFCLWMLTTPVLAQKSEWIDYVAAPEIVDGSRDKESRDVFFAQVKTDIVNKLAKGKYNVVLTNTAKAGVSGKEAANANHSAGNVQVASGDYDLLVRCTVSQYDIGKKFVEAHTETVMVPVTATVLDITGHPQTITIQEQQVYNVPAGEYPAAFVQARFDVINAKTNQAVWTWEDTREKVAELGLLNVKPKEAFTSIIADFSTSLRHNLKSRKPKEK